MIQFCRWLLKSGNNQKTAVWLSMAPMMLSCDHPHHPLILYAERVNLTRANHLRRTWLQILLPFQFKRKIFFLTNLLCTQRRVRADVTRSCLYMSCVCLQYVPQHSRAAVRTIMLDLSNIICFPAFKKWINKYVVDFVLIKLYLPGKGARKTRNISVSDEIFADINCWHISSVLGGK